MTEPILVPRPVTAPTTDRRRLVVLLAVAAVLVVVLLVVVPRALGGGDTEPFEFPATPTTVDPELPSEQVPAAAVDSGRNPFAPG